MKVLNTPNNYTIHSPFNELPDTDEKTVPELLLSRAKKHSEEGKTNRITDTITGESYDFESFEILTRNVASALYKRGLRKGDVVIFMTYDLVKLTIFQAGVWRANGILRASYPEDDEATILARVEESRVGWIYCEPESVEMCLSVAKNIYWDVEVIVTRSIEVTGCTSIFDLMDDDGTEIPAFDCSAKDSSIILNTSGTTGMSKGAVLTHEALIWMIRGFEIFPFETEIPNLIISKGTHISGLAFTLASITKGIHILVMHSIQKKYMFEAIQTFRPKAMFAFPSLLVSLINDPEANTYDFSSLEILVGGGAAVTSAIEKILLQLPNTKYVLNAYGLTEAAPMATSVDSDAVFSGDENIKLADVPKDSIGKLVAGVSARFQDYETGELVGPNQTGELCLKCKGIFKEYLNNPKATETAFIDGFFKTGDIGYYDENGFLFLIDRAKEIFKYFGNHVSPTEIENIINDHPSVGEVCVIGVPDLDGGGHVPRAFCVVLQNAECTPEEIIEFTNRQLPSFKHLRGGVYFVERLPKGKTGKVTRQLVEQLEIN